MTAAIAQQPASVEWSGFRWAIKTSDSPVPPGPNIFDAANVWIDGRHVLHLKISKNAAGAWTAAELIGPTLGYGSYTFSLASRVDTLDANAVLGLFTWSDQECDWHRELDIEFAKWGNVADLTNAQYAVQPYDRPEHLRRFTQPADARSTHRFTWTPNRIRWESHDAANRLIDAYEHRGSDVPHPGDERIRLNLWLYEGAPPKYGRPIEVALSRFEFAR